MFWKKEASVAMIRASAPPDPAQVEHAGETIAAFFEALGNYVTDALQVHPSLIRDRCEAWADEAKRAAERPGKAIKHWRKLLATFSKQREQEVSGYLTSSKSLRTAITTFGRSLTTLVTTQRSTDASLDSKLTGLQCAIDTGSSEQIRSAASRLLEDVSDSLTRSREALELQRKLLKSEIRTLEQQGCCAGVTVSLDPVTRLDNSSSLSDHLEFLAELGDLLSHPPVLLLVRIDQWEAIVADFGQTAADGVLKGVADQLLRTFMGRQDFVARYDATRLAAVLLDRPAVEAEQRARELVDGMAARALSVGATRLDVTLSVGLASLTPGESTAPWRERAEQACLDAFTGGRRRVVLSDVPGEFVS